MATKPDLVTFDVYTALLDIEGSLTPRLAAALELDSEKAGALVRLWRAKQMERAAASNVLGLGRILFRDATRIGLDYVLRRCGLSLDEEARDALVAAWDKLDPWPEADWVLGAVKVQGHEIALLSNGDQDMLEAVADRFAVAFDYVLSSEAAGFYKPHPAVYALPSDVVGVPMDKVLHVAGSPNDVLGAAAAGMPCVWSNRTGDVVTDPDYAPVGEIPNLSGVLEYI